MKKALVVLVLMGIGSAACSDDVSTEGARLLDSDGKVQLQLEITIAETEYERAEGLRLHGPLGENEGLLLLFPREGQVCISNRGVPFPIDVIYFSGARTVVATKHRIPANAAGPYCQSGTQLALELRGDTLRTLNYSKLEIF